MPAHDPSFEDLPAIPRDDEGGPVFRAPWEAHAFAMAVSLAERGLFTWKEWAQALATEIEAAQAAGDPDLGDTYYRHWLNALQGLLERKGVVDAALVSRRRDEWRRAYLNTPHGQPVELGAGTETPLERPERAQLLDRLARLPEVGTESPPASVVRDERDKR
ncbi:MAG: nitrile hydratase accessory protein [Gammaproteobacteria bacterium]|nr:nitrile hydratase accessory protein [Gammaproteobacteria bacterium]